ncbi:MULTISPECIES: hypothetical protein [Streptomyces]|uniref:Uncharacterized protein n=1 Tax=Streptomyces parvus TaxID=66428 RepID=A0A5D4JKJ0_9ACTN|nr:MULTISPECIES: hypothetical protein [Streptomyces]PVC98480.1 hypothetical protein DBP12_10520 [Streptomyces sp. CS014]TYR65454.1 hypothetical protein FY004_06185 [Streptomyces parvus]
MSDCTDVILLFSYLEDAVMEEIARLDPVLTGLHPRGLKRVSGDEQLGHWGGNPRGAECHVVAGTFNHLDAEKLRATLRTLPWKCPHAVQLLLHNENDAAFGMWMLLDRDWAEVPLPRTVRDGAGGHLRRMDCPDGEYLQP